MRSVGSTKHLTVTSSQQPFQEEEAGSRPEPRIDVWETWQNKGEANNGEGGFGGVEGAITGVPVFFFRVLIFEPILSRRY